MKGARLGMALVLAVCAVSSAAQEGVYKTVDQHGRVIYTDQRPAGNAPVETVALPPTNAMPAPVVTATAAGVAAEEKPAQPVEYTRFEMATPRENEVMEYDVRAVTLSVIIRPALQEGHTVQFYLDGQPLGAPGLALSIEVGELERGAHRAEARLRDERGNLVEVTGVVEFQIRQHSVLYDDHDHGYPYDYPYGSRGARQPGGARSPGDIASPEDVDGSHGSGEPRGAGSPVQRYRQQPRQ